MQSPTATSTSTSATAYTTIPISGCDAISRSIHNLSATVSAHRSWPEFLATGILDRPDSLSAAVSRLRRNAAYFRINYVILISSSAALSLIGTPTSLLLFALVFALWLILHFFREDPLIVRGYHLRDKVVLIGLALISIMAFWFGGVSNLMVGVAIGVLICGVHGVLRNPDGLFLDESEAMSSGLIGSGSKSGPA